jgi:hypothetical protein
MTERQRVPLGPIRELLFADLDVAGVRRTFRAADPPPDDGPDIGTALIGIADAVERGDRDDVEARLKLLLATGPESRVRLQAWTQARAAGLEPGPDAGRVRGAIVEMGLEQGVDTVAGYEDGSARYLNQGGGGVFWDAAEPEGGEIRGAIGRLLEVAQSVADATGPLDGRRPGPPDQGSAAIWLLTDGGVHVGVGPAGALTGDALGGPVIAAAVGLMSALIERSQRSGDPRER